MRAQLHKYGEDIGRITNAAVKVSAVPVSAAVSVLAIFFGGRGVCCLRLSLLSCEVRRHLKPHVSMGWKTWSPKTWSPKTESEAGLMLSRLKSQCPNPDYSVGRQ